MLHVRTLKDLCSTLKVAQKIINPALKEKMKKKQLMVPTHLHKAIYAVKKTPWTYPRPYYIKRHGQLPIICTNCDVATVPCQIKLHHLPLPKHLPVLSLPPTISANPASFKPNCRNVTCNLVSLCANCHSLEHHPRGCFDKEC